MFKIEHKITQKKIFLGLGPGSDPIKKQRYAHFEAEMFWPANHSAQRFEP